MRALFWKEIRENLLWAVLGGLCAAGAMFYGLRSDPERFNYGNNVWMSMQSPQVLLVTSFGFPVIAAALGFLQILTEMRRDQWAFLLHRPVTLTQIYLGKAIPGMLLYLLATLVPLFLVAWWVSLPGSIPAPFDWRMTQTGVIDALTGSAFYFAALWTGLAPGRWYGRRLLPLLAACYGAVGTKGYLSLAMAMPIALITLIAVVPASLATFQTLGQFHKQRWWGKMATVLALLLGVSILWQWASAGWYMVFPRQPYTGNQYIVTKQGQFVRLTQQGSWMKNVALLNGEELSPPEGKGSWSWDDFLPSNYITIKQQAIEYDPSYRQPGTFFRQIYSNSPNEMWYFIRDLECFASYDQRTKLRRGYLGPQGFRPTAEAAGRFPKTSEDFRYQGFDGPFQAGNALYRPRLARNEIAKVYEAYDGEKLLGGGELLTRGENQDQAKTFLVATDKSLRALKEDGDTLWTLPQPDDIASYSTLLAMRMEDSSKYFLIYQPYNQSKTGTLLYKLSPAGQVLERTEIPPSQPGKVKVTWKTVRTRIAFPLGQNLWEHVYGMAYTAAVGKKVKPVWKYTPDLRNLTLTIWGIQLGMGVLCAAASLLLFPRLKLTRGEKAGWLIFIVFYSVAGLLVFYLANAWPRRVRCASCAKARSVERDLCEHCGAPWPTPQRDGTEIFENTEPAKA